MFWCIKRFDKKAVHT